MKRTELIVLFCLLVLMIGPPVQGQESNCKNLGFELGNFAYWKGYQWVYSTTTPSKSTPKVAVTLPTSRRHVIITDYTAYDPNTGNGLKKIPPGYKFSARLGDAITSADPGSFRCWEQSLRYTMTIDSTNALLVMKFALVLQYAGDHTAKMEPRFRVNLYDQRGDSIPDCANYDVFSSNSNVKGFHSYTPQGAADPIKWRDWTTVGVNLLKYKGQSITIEFMTADCTGNFHFGYAYFVAACHPLQITVKYCAGDSVAGLTAPEGFEKYRWVDEAGIVVGDVQSLNLTNPPAGSVYTCNMTSETGCTVPLKSTIAKYVVHNGFTSEMIDCHSNTVKFTNQSTASNGTLEYEWDFGDGNISSEKNPIYRFASSGLHQVSLILKNPPSLCVDTLTRVIESFSPPLVGIGGDSTYCPGRSVFIKAYGAYDYTWSNGDKTDSIAVAAPGGKYWMIGRSSTGCVSDTIYKTVSEEPDWVFSNESDTSLCTGGSAVLKVSGAVNYRWSTRDTTSFIEIKTPGTYTVTGENRRGCQKLITINVKEYSPPAVDFTLSDLLLDSKHNLLTCSIQPQPDIQYIYDLGDGTTETGATIEHTYTITGSTLDYKILLTATHISGCTNSSTRIVDVIPFVPNVFSPNGDGINDVFMPETEAEVFDRYGKILYSGITGWDGNYHGQPADPDTYFYLIKYFDRFQQVHTKKGFITLVR
jgi:gliding motility-associated-like protein